MQSSAIPAAPTSSIKPYINSYDEHDFTPLMRAIFKSDLAAVKELLALGADVNLKSRADGMSPLYFASSDPENLPILETLLAAGADINATNYEGTTALHQAEWHDNKEAVTLLLQNGADINRVNNDGETVLSIAFKKGNGENVERIKFYLEKGLTFSDADRAYLHKNSIHLELTLQHPVATEYPPVRKLWSVFGDDTAIRQALVEKNALQTDGGRQHETLPLLQEQLLAFANNHDEHQALLNNIYQIFLNAAAIANDNKLPNNNRIAPGYAKLGTTGYKGHFVGLLIIKTANDKYKLIYSDRLYKTDKMKASSKSTPLIMIDVPADKLDAVITQLSDAKQAQISKQNFDHLIWETIPKLTGSKNQVIEDIVQHDFHTGRCYIENYYPIILLLMQLSLGVEQGHILFKHFMLSMRKNVLNDYKKFFADNITDKDKNVIALCEAMIAKKQQSLAQWEQGFEFNVIPQRQSLLETIFKDAYQQTYYNVEDTTKSRLLAFLELPKVSKRYNIATRKVEDQPSDYSLTFEWIAYIIFGFLYYPVINTIKLAVEFLPKCIENAADAGINFLINNYYDDRNQTPFWKKVFAGAGLAILAPIYVAAKIVKVATRIVTSPAASAAIGWKIHPLLGIASGILSLAAMALITFLVTPLFAIDIATAATSLGLTKIAAAATAVMNFFWNSSNATRALGIITTTSTLMSSYWSAIKGISNVVSELKRPDAVKLADTLDDLHCLNEKLDTEPAQTYIPVQDTKGIYQAIGAPPVVQGGAPPSSSNNNNHPGYKNSNDRVIAAEAHQPPCDEIIRGFGKGC